MDDYTKHLQFVDVIEAMIESGEHSNQEIIEMIRLMQNEVDRLLARRSAQNPVVSRFDAGGDDDEEWGPRGYLDYEELFKLFVLKRKIKLLRFLFSLDKNTFDFHPGLFLMALELDAYDMAALIYKEFFRLLRNLEPQQLEFALTNIVSSYKKANGMIDFKAYLVR